METILASLSCYLGESCVSGVSQPKNYSRTMIAKNISALHAFVSWVFASPNQSFYATKIKKSWGEMKKNWVFSTLLNIKLWELLHILLVGFVMRSMVKNSFMMSSNFFAVIFFKVTWKRNATCFGRYALILSNFVNCFSWQRPWNSRCCCYRQWRKCSLCNIHWRTL